jgi:y4mF family transcriptional regulator
MHSSNFAIIFPYGNFIVNYSPAVIGKLIRTTRKQLGSTQKDLALTSGTGLRFIIELEKGKETCELGKVLTVLKTLGIKMALTPPAAASGGSPDGPHA